MMANEATINQRPNDFVFEYNFVIVRLFSMFSLYSSLFNFKFLIGLYQTKNKNVCFMSYFKLDCTFIPLSEEIIK